MTKNKLFDTPAHYDNYTYEAIDIFKVMNYPLLSHALKYIWRCGYKDSPEKDLDKAKNYIDLHYNDLLINNNGIDWYKDECTFNKNLDYIKKIINITQNEMDNERFDVVYNILMLDLFIPSQSYDYTMILNYFYNNLCKSMEIFSRAQFNK